MKTDMTKEEKQLLLKDLSARLPYGVKCRFETTIDKYKTIEFSREGTNGLYVDFDELYCYWFNEGFILPYLRPMSSMTEEERGQYMEFIEWSHNDYDGTTTTCIIKEKLHEYLDFIYSHHFDDNGLIENGLALEAPEGMYKTE